MANAPERHVSRARSRHPRPAGTNSGITACLSTICTRGKQNKTNPAAASESRPRKAGTMLYNKMILPPCCLGPGPDPQRYQPRRGSLSFELELDTLALVLIPFAAHQHQEKVKQHGRPSSSSRPGPRLRRHRYSPRNPSIPHRASHTARPVQARCLRPKDGSSSNTLNTNITIITTTTIPGQ